MKILFSTGCLFYLPLKEIFLLAGEAGFDGCDLVIDSHFVNPRCADHLSECVDILPVHSVHAPFIKMRSWGTKAEALSRSIEIGRSVSASVVNFHPPSWYSMELQFLQWFKKVTDFQKELSCEGLDLAIENMPLAGKRVMLASYILNDFRDLINFGLERNLFFTFDTTHLGTFGDDLVTAFLSFYRTGRLRNIHLSDYGGSRSHLFLGSGELPMVKLLNTMRRLGYDGMVTLEVAPSELPKATPWLVKMMRYQLSLVRLHLGGDTK
jgi:sugar phosphate isomerase/epimerase